MKQILWLATLLCIFGVGQVQAEAVFKIGVLLCQTGPCAETGTSALKGAELAVSEINSKGGLGGSKIELVIQDTREADSGGGSVSAFHALTSDKAVHILIGPTWDVGAMPLVPLMQKKKELLLISPSVGVEEFSSSTDNIFNLWPLDEVAVAELAKLSINSGWRKASILSAEQNWAKTQARAFKSEFEQLGGKLLAVEEPLSTQTDVKIESIRLSAAKPDVILLTMFAHLPTAVKQLRQLGFTGQFLSVQMDPDRIKLSGTALDGTIFPKFESSDEKFVEAFQKKYSSSPQMAADTGYDSVYLIAHASETCKGMAPSCLRQACQAADFTGASGRISFSKNRTILRQPQFFEVRSGKTAPFKAFKERG